MNDSNRAASASNPGRSSRKKILIPAGILLLVVGGFLYYARSAAVPAGVGVGGPLADCPDRPNCVSSREEGDAAIEPLRLPGEAPRDLRSLVPHVMSLGDVTIRKQEDGYLHAEVRTPRVGFIDDLELWLEEPAGPVHVRSASRRGYSDLGVNRDRVEKLRARIATGVPEKVETP